MDVTVAFVCGDAAGGSGVDSCGPGEVVSTDVTAKSVEGKAIDGAGNETSATVDAINIDKVNPTIWARACRSRTSTAGTTRTWR